MADIKTGADFRAWRRDMGMTQPEVATLMRVSLRTVAQWESRLDGQPPGPACLAAELLRSALVRRP